MFARSMSVLVTLEDMAKSQDVLFELRKFVLFVVKFWNSSVKEMLNSNYCLMNE